MDLRDDPSEYAELVASSTAPYALLVGIVVAIIFSIAGLIAFTVLYEGAPPTIDQGRGDIRPDTPTSNGSGILED